MKSEIRIKYSDIDACEWLQRWVMAAVHSGCQLHYIMSNTIGKSGELVVLL